MTPLVHSVRQHKLYTIMKEFPASRGLSRGIIRQIFDHTRIEQFKQRREHSMLCSILVFYELDFFPIRNLEEVMSNLIDKVSMLD
jgi:hypothetical protein